MTNYFPSICQTHGSVPETGEGKNVGVKGLTLIFDFRSHPHTRHKKNNYIFFILLVKILLLTTLP